MVECVVSSTDGWEAVHAGHEVPGGKMPAAASYLPYSILTFAWQSV